MGKDKRVIGKGGGLGKEPRERSSLLLNCKWFNLSRIHSFNRGMEREGIEGEKSFSLSPLLPPFLPFHFSCPPFFPPLLLSFISSLFFLPFNIVLQINKAPYQMLAWSQRISSDLYLYGVIRSPKILINAIASHFLFFPFSLAISPKCDL